VPGPAPPGQGDVQIRSGGQVLGMADRYVFPSIGAVNPALTVMASAIRVGDHLIQRMR
jgi:choline dehydrogenase-like flavoprotein